MFAEVLNGYSEDLRAKVPKSIYHYRSHARTFLRWLARKNVPLGAVAAEHVDAYLRYRRSSGNRLQTLKNDLCRLRHFFRFAQQQGVVASDPTERVLTRWLNIAGGFPAYRGSLARTLGLRPAFLLRYRLEIFGSDWEQFLERLIEQGYTRPGIRTIARHKHSGLSHLLAERGIHSVGELIGRALPNPITGFMELTAVKKISAVHRELCQHCGNCTRCPYQALSLDKDRVPETDPAKCIGCSICAQKCFSGALHMRERTKKETAVLQEA